MRTVALALLAGTVLAAPAFAMQEPRPSKQDSRIRMAAYSSADVIHISSTDLQPVQIVLQDGEEVASFAGLNVATATKPDEMKNVHDWFMRWSGNAIVLQPLRQEKPSLLFVDTKAPNGTMRHYRFQIDTRGVPSNADDTHGPAASVAFTTATPAVDPGAYDAVNMTYPDVIAAQRRAAWQAAAPERERRAEERARKNEAEAAEWRLKQAQSPYATGRNWHYEAQNISASDNSCDVIGPERAAGISDDGLQTRLLFAPHATMPVPYVLDQDGKESVVQHSQQETGDGLVMTLHTVTSRIILRRGDRVCALTNMAFDPVGHQTGTGTVLPDIVREVRQ
jgi:type IV secretion system protein VirB9